MYTEWYWITKTMDKENSLLHDHDAFELHVCMLYIKYSLLVHIAVYKLQNKFCS